MIVITKLFNQLICAHQYKVIKNNYDKKYKWNYQYHCECIKCGKKMKTNHSLDWR